MMNLLLDVCRVRKIHAPLAHGLRERHDAARAASDHAECADLVRCRLQHAGGTWADSIELRIRRLDRYAERLGPAPGHGGRGLYRDLLAEHGAHGELEAIECPRHAQARQTAHHACEQGVRAEERAPSVGRRAEIEQMLDAY